MRKPQDRKEYHRKRKSDFIAAGLCSQCGKPKDDGFVKCSICREKYRLYKNQPHVKPIRKISQAKWAKSEKAKPVLAKRDAAYYEKTRKGVFDHYGNSCACCGEKIVKFLTIDHINGGGNKERKAIFGSSGAGGRRFWAWLRSQGYPSGYQTLCYNCNCGRAKNNGICPHKE